MIGKLFKAGIEDTKTVIQSLRNDGFKKTFQFLNSRDAPGFVQFAKYGVCGVIAVLVLLVFTELASHFLNLPFDKSDGTMDLQKAEDNFIICTLIAFPFSNLAAYLLNVIWVFTPGKHSRLKEFSMFTAIALFACVVGLFAGPVMISKGLHPRIAQLGLIIASTLVNFACRKLLIFLK